MLRSRDFRVRLRSNPSKTTLVRVIDHSQPNVATERARVCVVTTTPLIVNFFLRGSLAALASKFDVSLIANFYEAHKPLVDHIALSQIAVRIERKISLWRDLVALLRLTKIFAVSNYRVVHSIAPKAGLLAMIAAWIARVPVRIHTFQGEAWVTRTGLMRVVLKCADRVVARLATHSLVVSVSEQAFLIEQGILRPGQSTVLAKGSISGVDVNRFCADAAIRLKTRKAMGIDESDFVFLFLGRIAREKGVLDLSRAFALVAAKFPQTNLLVVGPDEENLRSEILSGAGSAQPKVTFRGLTDTPEQVLAGADAICLPSYREAFGMVIIEAAAMGIPAVASRIYGITDAVVEGETGLLHAPRDTRDLATQMEKLLVDPGLRRRLGDAARERAQRDFRSERIVAALMEYYEKAISHDIRHSSPIP